MSTLSDTQKNTIDRLIDTAVNEDDGHDARYRLARLAEDARLGDAIDTRDEALVLAAIDRVLAARDAIEEE